MVFSSYSHFVQDLSELNTIFWERDDSFDEMTKFSDATAAEYGNSTERRKGGERHGLEY